MSSNIMKRASLVGVFFSTLILATSHLSAQTVYYVDAAIMKGFTVYGDYIQIKGFEITDPDFDWTDGWGINIKGNNVTVENNEIHNCVLGGIISTAANATIKDNRCYRNGMQGISIQGVDNLIEGNEIWDTIEHHPKWLKANGGPYDDYPSWADADGMRFFGSGHVFRNNSIHDIHFGDPGINPDKDDWIDDAHIDCFQTWEDLGSNLIAGHDIVFEQNYCEVLTSQAERENGHGFMLSGGANNLIIRNNIFKTYGGINTGGDGHANHLYIYNNLWIGSLAFTQFWPNGLGLSDAPHSKVKNNIFYDQPYHTISVTGNTTGQEIDHNLAYRSDAQPSDCYRVDYQCVDPLPPHDLWDVDPKFLDPDNDDYRLQADSPAIDAGATLAEVTDDYDGTSRPQEDGYDMGAYEYRSNVPYPPNKLRIIKR